MLRSSGSQSMGTTESAATDPEQLDAYTTELFEWMGVRKTLRIRMMLQWQGAGGLPYAASVHHRATQCFRYEGNTKHDAGNPQKGITLEEWQRAIQERHRVGSSGIEDGKQADSADFKAMTG